MKAAVLAFIVIVGSVSATQLPLGKRFPEHDLVDLARMNLREYFEDWAGYFGKTYSSAEEKLQRFGVFVEGMQKIAAHNSGDHSWTMAPNQFTDLTPDEFVKFVHGDNGKCYNGNALTKLNDLVQDGEVAANPSSIDWSQKGVVTPVKNQGQCGSCWAFSTTGSIECRYAIKTGKLNSLSEQQLVDCSTRNSGCNGGEMQTAMDYVAKEGGLCSESEYKYTARDGTCKASSCGTKYDDISGPSNVKEDSESAMETAVAEGCVSVAIEADQTAFQYYSGGVLTGNCGTRLDHGVLIVGYGTDSGTDYWKVKNSWGTSWGEKGYVRICRNCNKNNGAGECGILEDGSVPVV
jgi:C1A family cysteine protease